MTPRERRALVVELVEATRASIGAPDENARAAAIFERATRAGVFDLLQKALLAEAQRYAIVVARLEGERAILAASLSALGELE